MFEGILRLLTLASWHLNKFCDIVEISSESRGDVRDYWSFSQYLTSRKLKQKSQIAFYFIKKLSWRNKCDVKDLIYDFVFFTMGLHWSFTVSLFSVFLYYSCNEYLLSSNYINPDLDWLIDFFFYLFFFLWDFTTSRSCILKMIEMVRRNEMVIVVFFSWWRTWGHLLIQFTEIIKVYCSYLGLVI